MYDQLKKPVLYLPLYKTSFLHLPSLEIWPVGKPCCGKTATRVLANNPVCKKHKQDSKELLPTDLNKLQKYQAYYMLDVIKEE